MKNLTLIVSLVALLGSFSASADGTLYDGDATNMAQILQSSGMAEIWDVTLGFVSAQNPYCVGSYYVDECFVTPADNLPAASPRTLKAGLESNFWSLLKKAGVPNSISDISGSAGDSTISAARIDCTLFSAPNQTDQRDYCTVKQ